MDLSPYQERLNLKDALFTRIDHQDAMVAVVYKVTQPDGTDHILKISTRPPDYFREVYFLNFFAGKLPVARIEGLVPPEAILMQCLPGKLLTISDLNEKIAYDSGSLLALIHNNRTAGYGDVIRPEELNPDPLYHYTLKFEEGLQECSANITHELLIKCRHFYQHHFDLLKRVDGPCLIHRDFRPGNILVEGNEVKGIIDWASARASFAEDDFSPLEHGEWSNDSKIKSAFLAGYASIRKVPDYTAIMRFLRMNRAVATIGYLVKTGKWNTTHTNLYNTNLNYLQNLSF